MKSINKDQKIFIVDKIRKQENQKKSFNYVNTLMSRDLQVLKYSKIVNFIILDKLEAIEEKNRKLLEKLIHISTTKNRNANPIHLYSNSNRLQA